MKDRCIIIAGGDADIFVLKGFITENDYIIAADSGYRYCNDLEVIPDLLVGDFDSYNEIIPNNIEVHRLPCVKDDTDLLYASRCAVDKKFKNIVIFGGYGSRPDQNLAMLQTLFWIKNNTENTEVSAICNGFEICALKNEKATFITNSNRYLSVFTFMFYCLSFSKKNKD